MLQWAHANECPWDGSTCSEAAYWGYFKMLKWARANGCLWSEHLCREMCRDAVSRDATDLGDGEDVEDFVDSLINEDELVYNFAYGDD